MHVTGLWEDTGETPHGRRENMRPAYIDIATERGLTQQLTPKGRQLVLVTPHKDTLFLSVKWSFSLMSFFFLQLLPFSSHHLVHIIPLTQQPHGRTDSCVISTSKNI